MLRTRTRWLTLAAATMIVGALLPASAALADTTPGSITGHLVDGTTPVPNVTVDVISPDFSFAGEATTDATGAFTVSDIPPGSYIVQFSLPGGLTQYSHGKTSFAAADLIAVTAGATTSDEETVIPHGALGGTLTDSTGAPVANATAQVASAGSSIFLTAQTDATGHYLVPIVPAGTYSVSFFVPDGIGQTAHGKPQGALGDQFTVTVGATTTVDEQLVAPGSFTGRVTTAQGLPAAGVAVYATNQFGSQFSQTDANGQYTVKVFPGTYQLQFQHGESLSQWAHGQLSQSTAQSFTVASGATAVVDEQLLPTGTIAGHLTDSNGQPVQFAGISITDGTHFFFSHVFNGDWQTEIYPGTYIVDFHPFGSPTGDQWATGKTSAAMADHFTVQAGQTTRVDDQLAAPGTVTVTVVDSVTGVPVQYCAVIGGSSFACSDSNGRASVQVLPGVLVVDITPRDNHLRITTTATVVSGQNTALSLTATPGAAITTTVRDSETGAPLRNICVSADKTTEPYPLSGPGACTDATGVVTVSGLAAGSYNLFALSQDSVHGHQWVGSSGGTGLQQKAAVTALTVGQAVTVPDIKMDKAGTLTGIIRDKATGAPIPGSFASFATHPTGEGPTEVDARADDNGSYTFTDLGPYDWPIFYHAAGYAGEWSGNTGDRLNANPITIKAGKTRIHNVTLGTGVTLTGRVTDPNGLPQSGRITVFNTDSRDEIGADDTTPDGTYTLHVMQSQSVALKTELFVAGEETQFFYVNSPDLEHATPIQIHNPGPITVNITRPPQG